MTIKIEPDIFERSLPSEKTPSKKLPNNSQSSSNQSTLLRSLIRTSQATKKDGPLYDLLQNLDTNDTPPGSTSSSSSTANNNNNNPNRNPNTNNNSIDPFEQFFTQNTSQQTKNPSSKDDYLAALLSSDPQQPNEISFVPANKQQTPPLNRSVSTSSDSNRIAAIVNDLFASTTAAAAALSGSTSNDDFLSVLDNRDFLEVKATCAPEREMVLSVFVLVFQRSNGHRFHPFAECAQRDGNVISVDYIET